MTATAAPAPRPPPDRRLKVLAAIRRGPTLRLRVDLLQTAAGHLYVSLFEQRLEGGAWKETHRPVRVQAPEMKRLAEILIHAAGEAQR